MSERRIDGPQGALNLSADDSGLATPVLFLHSDGGTLHHWDEVRAHLRGKRPTAAFDRRGHGNSDMPSDNSFDPVISVEDVDAIAEKARFLRFVLVGHSGGALTAFAYANHAPQRLAGLVLVDPPADAATLPPGVVDQTMTAMRGPNYEETVDTYYRSIAGDDPNVVERVLHDVKETPRSTIIATFDAMSKFRPADHVGQYKGPAVAIIQPQFDMAGALHRTADWPFTPIAGAGHWIHLGAPEKFNAVLDEFLAGVDARASR